MVNQETDWAQAEPTAPRRRAWLPYLLLAALCFLLGIAAMAWTLSRWDDGARMLGIARDPAPAATAPPPAEAPPAPALSEGETARQIMIDPEITRRLALLEQRVETIDIQSRAAVGNADRAEGLLVAFAARRALDRGVALGFLEALLRQRFGTTQPQAVGIIISAARDPVTLQELQDELQQAGPVLVGAGPDQSWWDALKLELGSLVTVRREGTPSAEPTERLRRVTRRLEAGHVDVALAEVLRMPGRGEAQDWVARARRYVLARRALDRIETAALLEPRAAPPLPQGQAVPQIVGPAAPVERQGRPAAQP